MAWIPKTNLTGPAGPQGDPGPQGIPGVNAVENDAAVAGYVRSAATQTAAAVGTLIEEHITADAAAGVDDVVARLDLRSYEPVVFATCGDSTMVGPDQYVTLALRELLAELWPERRAMYYDPLAGNANGAYDPAVQWQVGTSNIVAPLAVVFRDTFTRTGELVGSTADVAGGTWVGGVGQLTANGSALVPAGAAPAYSGQVAAQAHSGLDFSLTANLTISSTHAVKKTTRLGIYLDNNHQIYAEIGATTTATPQLIVRTTAAGTRAIGVFPALTIPSNTASHATAVRIDVTGTAISCTIGANTVTGTLTETERSALAAWSKVSLYADDPTMVLDNYAVEGRPLGDEATPVPDVAVYNPAVAGSRADFHLSRLTTVYPVRPDVLFFGHGHNYAATVTPEAFIAAVEEFMAAFGALYPGVPVVVVSENPRFAPAGDIYLMAEKMAAIRAHARRRGWYYIGTYEAMAAQTDGGRSLVQADGIHPNTAGSRQQADTIKAAIAALSTRS